MALWGTIWQLNNGHHYFWSSSKPLDLLCPSSLDIAWPDFFFSGSQWHLQAAPKIKLGSVPLSRASALMLKARRCHLGQCGAREDGRAPWCTMALVQKVIGYITILSFYLVGGDWNIFYFSIYWEWSSQLTHIFQRGWNHQPVIILSCLDLDSTSKTHKHHRHFEAVLQTYHE